MSRANCGGFQERFDDDPADLASRLGDPATQQAMAYVQGSLTTETSRVRYAIPCWTAQAGRPWRVDVATARSAIGTPHRSPDATYSQMVTGVRLDGAFGGVGQSAA